MTLSELISKTDKNIEIRVFFCEEQVSGDRYNDFTVESYFLDDIENVLYIDLDNDLLVCPCCGCCSNRSELIETVHRNKESFTVCHWCFEISKVAEWELYRI